MSANALFGRRERKRHGLGGGRHTVAPEKHLVRNRWGTINRKIEGNGRHRPGNSGHRNNDDLGHLRARCRHERKMIVGLCNDDIAWKRIRKRTLEDTAHSARNIAGVLTRLCVIFPTEDPIAIVRRNCNGLGSGRYRTVGIDGIGRAGTAAISADIRPSASAHIRPPAAAFPIRPAISTRTRTTARRWRRRRQVGCAGSQHDHHEHCITVMAAQASCHTSCVANTKLPRQA